MSAHWKQLIRHLNEWEHYSSHPDFVIFAALFINTAGSDQ